MAKDMKDEAGFFFSEHGHGHFGRECDPNPFHQNFNDQHSIMMVGNDE